jgi:histidyl-tRNA synthetase
LGGAPRGTHDLEGSELAAHRFIIDTARRVTSRYAFDEVPPPSLFIVNFIYLKI